MPDAPLQMLLEGADLDRLSRGPGPKEAHRLPPSACCPSSPIRLWTRRARAAGLLAALALSLGACGGGGGTGDGGELSATQANAFSRRFGPVDADLLALQRRYLLDALSSVGQAGAAGPRGQVDARTVRRFSSYERGMAAIERRARGLRPPVALEDDTEKLIGFMDSIERDLGKIARTVRAGDTAGLQNAGQNLLGHSSGMNRLRISIQNRLRAASR